jgi:predicted phosphodiesterase
VKSHGTIYVLYKEGGDSMERKEIGRIIVDGSGHEKPVFKKEWPSFPDKKKVNIDPSEIERIVDGVRKIKEEAAVGQETATWIPKMDYPDRPMLFLFLTDVHYTSIRSRHDLLNHYLDTVKAVPNMFMVTGGDDVDNFNITLGPAASGVYEDPIEPGIQSLAWQKKIGELDHKDKVGFMVFGNHTDWNYKTGSDWYDTFMGGLNCPILTSGGLVRVQFHHGAKYQIAATHRYWGSSKLNPTNTCKRYLEHEYPDADIVLLGHTHQSEVLHFERGGKERIGIIGGTLKQVDDYARKHGIGGRAGHPGHCIALWPNKQEMVPYKNFDRAVEEHLRRL